jgi:hypothetical protein
LLFFQCSTGNPCSECAAHNRQCVYDETADKRRKAYIKHTQNQLHFFRGFLERLLASIRYADNQRLAELIGVIRGGGTNYDILSVVQSILGDASRTDQMDGDQVDGDEMDGDQMDGDQVDGDEMDGDQMDGDQVDGEQIDGDSDDAEGSESFSGFAEGWAENKTWALIEFIWDSR